MPLTCLPPALSPGSLSSSPLRPSVPHPCPSRAPLLPASRVRRSHTPCLLSSPAWPLPRQAPLTAPSPPPPGSPFIHSAASCVPSHPPAPAPPPSRTLSSASGLPGLALGPPRRSRPSRGEGWSPRPPRVLPLLSRRGRAPTSPRPQPSPPQPGPAPPGMARPGGPPAVRSPPRTPGPLHLQLRLPRPRLCSTGDPHLPPSPALIGRCLTTDPHNKTSGSEPRLPQLSHQSAAAGAPPPASLDQSKEALLPLFLSSRPLFLNRANHEEEWFKSHPSAPNEPMRVAVSLVPPSPQTFPFIHLAYSPSNLVSV